MADNIRKYRRPLNLNIGMILFAVIMLYIIVCVFMYFTSKHIVGYEVKTGSLSVSNVFEGIAIRHETIVKSDYTGYINYFATEGEKTGAGKIVCSIDETGKLMDMLESDTGENKPKLTNADYSEIKNAITEFSGSFDNGNFLKVYDFKYELQGNVTKYANRTLMNSLEDLYAQSGDGLINIVNSPKSGIVVYSIDGFEDYKSTDVTADWFKKEDYEKTQLVGNNLVSNGDPIYKLTDDEKWSVIISVDEDRIPELVAEEYIKVKFLKNQTTSWAQIEAITGADGKSYIELHFNNSMINFVADRYVSVELITASEVGLKVPNSSILEKEFFLIPTEYVTKSGINNADTVLKQTFDEEGNSTVTNINITIYHEEDGSYYVDNDILQIGDRIFKPDSNEEYTISKSATLIGVYNINKGYADFKEIQVLNSNDEYSIVKSNTEYGLVAYDYIVLDAESVELDEFIYD